ncbi:MAG: prolipoprotein diacylglyceryl transferase [Oligoflexia bacterium]|nr:prolipoprotein diacylglyceryl transferase [Oligoflexia bacterium]
MYPILMKIGPITIHGYGSFLALGFFLCMLLALRDNKKYNLNYNDQMLRNLFLWIVIASAIGARLFHVLIEKPSFYFDNPMAIIKVWDNGGVTFYGGFIAAIIGSYLYCRKHKWSMFLLSDYLIVYVPLGQTFARIGCFLSGCCYGIPTNLPWGIAIHNPASSTLPLHVSLHPTQLYQAFWNLLTFIIIYRNAFNKEKRTPGDNIILFGLIYPIGRIVIEFFRGDEVRGYVISNLLTVGQFISLIILICAGRLFFSKKSRPAH